MDLGLLSPLTFSIKGCIIIARRTANMVHNKFVARLVFSVALAIFAGACAQKKMVTEVPRQPEPETVTSSKEPIETKVLVPEFETPEQLKARQAKADKKAEEDEENTTLEQELKRTRETRKQRQERLAQQKGAELERLVFVPTQEERDILARAAEIDAKKATEAAQKAKEVGDSPSMRQARRERARSEKNAREVAKFAIESKRNTGLRCQNQQDFDNVVIHPESGNRYVTRSHSTFVINNLLDVPVDILFASGGEDPVAVEQMCPGGMITIQKALDTFLSGNIVSVSYTAYAPGVEIAQPVSQVVTIQACRVGIGGSCIKEFRGRWDIRARRR